MTDRFEHEFYGNRWQRVLPLGPHGIQPYVWPSRRTASPGRRLRRLAAITKMALGQSIGFGRRLAVPDERAGRGRYARAGYN